MTVLLELVIWSLEHQLTHPDKNASYIYIYQHSIFYNGVECKTTGEFSCSFL